jgi:hypothetical protein
VNVCSPVTAVWSNNNTNFKKFMGSIDYLRTLEIYHKKLSTETNNLAKVS